MCPSVNNQLKGNINGITEVDLTLFKTMKDKVSMVGGYAYNKGGGSDDSWGYYRDDQGVARDVSLITLSVEEQRLSFAVHVGLTK